MYGLYKDKKKYFVQNRNIRNKKKLIVQNDNLELLNRITKNLNLKIPVVKIHKDIVENTIEEFEPEYIHNISHNCQILSTKDISIDESIIQRDIPDENVNNELQTDFISHDLLQEDNLLADINLSDTNNIENNANSPVTFSISFSELNDLDIFTNTDICYEDIERNSIFDNNFETDNHHYSDNGSTENDDIEDEINDNIIDDVESNINQKSEKLLQPHSYVDNSAYDNDDSSDDVDKDPDYNADSENSEEESDILVQPCLTQSNNNTHSSLETSLNVTGQKICDDANLHVECSNPKGIGKQNFCYYCKKMQSKISRHLERVHKDEEEVKKFTLLPKGNKERQKIIALIRRRGNYIFNTDPAYNKGELIVCRRPTESKKRTACDFICCAKCKGFFTKNNIRHHFKECTQKAVGRSVKILGRKVESRIHESASSILRNVVFPVLREDDITRLIRYDELLIIYGNKLCVKYKYQHQQDMIRSRLRLLGRFLQALRKINKNVTDFFSLYHPSIYDDCIVAVNQVAGLNTSSKVYKAPSVAARIGTLLKQIGNLSIAECIKRNKSQEKVNIENFLKLLQEDFSVSVNKNVEESILQTKRYKLQELPPLEDIKLLHNFLQTNRRLTFRQLKDVFTFNTWRQLAEFTLISILVFNRRRAGEIERISIDDYKHQEGINEQTNPDLYESLSDEARKIAEKYVRILLRGKLARPVPVLLDHEMKDCIDLLLQYRKEANIPVGNPYIFSLPGYDKKRFKYIRACDLLRTYSVDCGASMPHRLRGTKLRKHIATRCITLNLSEPDVTELANHLGHDKSIHMQHYRQSIPQIEVVKMSRLLNIAQGNVDNIEQEIEEDDNLQINEERNSFVMETSQMAQYCDKDDSDESYTRACDTEKMHERKRRSTSPYGSTKRVRWTEEESNLITTSFKQEISERRLPSGRQMVELKVKNKCLSRRSIPQIRSWIHNHIFKKFKLRTNNK